MDLRTITSGQGCPGTRARWPRRRAPRRPRVPPPPQPLAASWTSSAMHKHVGLSPDGSASGTKEGALRARRPPVFVILRQVVSFPRCRTTQLGEGSGIRRRGRKNMLRLSETIYAIPSLQVPMSGMLEEGHPCRAEAPIRILCTENCSASEPIQIPISFACCGSLISQVVIILLRVCQTMTLFHPLLCD